MTPREMRDSTSLIKQNVMTVAFFYYQLKQQSCSRTLAKELLKLLKNMKKNP